MKAYEQTLTFLNTLSLKGLVNSLDEMVNDAEIIKNFYITFLNNLFTTEISYRVMRRKERHMTAAHFPVIKKIDDFDFGRVKGIGKSEAINLLDCRWIDNQENLLFFGPPGVGKTHLGIAFAVAAIEKGYKVCFERISNLIKLLKTAEIQKKSEYRIKRLILSFTAVRTEHFVETDLFRYNVIIFPHGSPNSYKRLLGGEGITKLKIWIKNGGTFIGIKGGAVFTTLKGVELTDIKLITEISDENTKKSVDTIPGSTFKAAANTDYYLGLGYPEEIAVKVLSSYLFSKTELGANVVTFPQNSFMMGHKWKDTEEILEDKLYLTDVPMDQGHVILYADDPTFRCYWTGLDRLFLSSILFSTAMN